jgi:hypothetical protein
VLTSRFFFFFFESALRLATPPELFFLSLHLKKKGRSFIPLFVFKSLLRLKILLSFQKKRTKATRIDEPKKKKSKKKTPFQFLPEEEEVKEVKEEKEDEEEWD